MASDGSRQGYLSASRREKLYSVTIAVGKDCAAHIIIQMRTWRRGISLDWENNGTHLSGLPQPFISLTLFYELHLSQYEETHS